MTDTLLDRTLYYARRLAPIPNAPFLHGPMLDEILAILAELGIRNDHTTPSRRGVYALDDYCLYVHIRRGQARHPILIDSHLDHPAFVLDGKGGALAFGSVGYQRIARLLAQSPIDLRIYDPDGRFLGLGQLTELDVFSARVQTPFAISPNCHGLWNVVDFAEDGDSLRLHAADNMIATDVMLALIEDVIEHPEVYPDVDVTFAFTFLEEVFEASASALAMRRQTPFAAIDEKWRIFVLEAMEPVPLYDRGARDRSPTLRGQRLIEDRTAVRRRMEATAPPPAPLHPLYEALALPHPAADAGVAIKVNDMDCVYGFAFPDLPNLAESILLQAASALGVRHQHTIFGGACNGTAYSLFPTTGHIATLSVPNPYKHNIYLDGSIVPEVVKRADVEAAGLIMAHMLQSISQVPSAKQARSLGQKLKQTDLAPAPVRARRLRAERGSIAWSARWRLRHRGYFGRNLGQQAAFSIRGAVARLREPLARLTG